MADSPGGFTVVVYRVRRRVGIVWSRDRRDFRNVGAIRRECAADPRRQNRRHRRTARQRNRGGCLNGGVDMNRQASGRDIPGEMRAKQVRAWRQRTEFEPAVLIRYCDRRRRPKSGNDDVRDRLTAVVFHGAGDGAGCLRCTYDRRGGWLGLRRSEQWCAECDQTADCRRRYKSGCPCHIELRGPIPDCLPTNPKRRSSRRESAIYWRSCRSL